MQSSKSSLYRLLRELGGRASTRCRARPLCLISPYMSAARRFCVLPRLGRTVRSRALGARRRVESGVHGRGAARERRSRRFAAPHRLGTTFAVMISVVAFLRAFSPRPAEVADLAAASHGRSQVPPAPHGY